MRTDGTIETLIRFGISDVCKALRKYDKRLTLSKIDNYLQKNPEKEKFPITLEWTCTIKNTVYWREWTNSVKLSITIGRDGGGLYLSFDIVSGDKKSWFDYYLTKRESNLKPGTYRYYFLDPFSVKVGDICSKLYYLPKINEFVPRSVLPSWGYLYRQGDCSAGGISNTESPTTEERLLLSGVGMSISVRGRISGLLCYYFPGERLRMYSPPNWGEIVLNTIRTIPGADVEDSTKGRGRGLSLSYQSLPYPEIFLLLRLVYPTFCISVI